MKTPVSMLHNRETGRFHPIAFRPAPLPSGPVGGSGSGYERFKSIGHHTNGFDTEKEALAYIKEHADWLWMEEFLEWDGEGSPAAVSFFDTHKL